MAASMHVGGGLAKVGRRGTSRRRRARVVPVMAARGPRRKLNRTLGVVASAAAADELRQPEDEDEHDERADGYVSAPNGLATGGSGRRLPRARIALAGPLVAASARNVVNKGPSGRQSGEQRPSGPSERDAEPGAGYARQP